MGDGWWVMLWVGDANVSCVVDLMWYLMMLMIGDGGFGDVLVGKIEYGLGFSLFFVCGGDGVVF